MNPANMLAAQASTVVLAVAVSDIWIGLEDDTDSRNGTRRFWLFVHGGETRHHNWLPYGRALRRIARAPEGYPASSLQ